ISYRGPSDKRGGAPTPYGLDLDLVGHDPRAPEHRPVSHIRLLFAPKLGRTNPDALVERFLRYAALGPFTAGACGLELVLRTSEATEGWWSADLIQERLDHLPAFEHPPGRDQAPGTAPGVAWLTLVGYDLLKRLSIANSPQWISVPGGACVRA